VADRVLTVNDVAAGYGPLEILHGVNLTIERGQFVCLLGPNGAGKSTLLKAIFGMCTITAGSIRWRGTELRGLKPQRILGHGVAYVPQGRCNFPLMTVAENLEMAAYTRRDDAVKTDEEEVYRLFPILATRRQQLAGNLSGGEQQMLEMGMAMLRRPELLMLDEPSMGLSPQAITAVFREVQRLHAGGRTVVLVEQNTRKAMEVAERAVVLRLGRVIWTGPTPSITHGDLGALFMTGRLPDTSAAVTRADDT
jgi:branched-chain amino acid transport system ATP-binding protein